MIFVKEVKINESASIIAHIQCQDSVGLNEENKIRKLLENFYAKEKPDFARVALEVNGSVILFRATHNCKRSPGDWEIAKILQAINCQATEVVTRLSHKKRTDSVSHHKAQTA